MDSTGIEAVGHSGFDFQGAVIIPDAGVQTLQPDVSLKDFVLLNEAGRAGLSAVLEIVSDFGSDLFVTAAAVEHL